MSQAEREVGDYIDRVRRARGKPPSAVAMPFAPPRREWTVIVFPEREPLGFRPEETPRTNSYTRHHVELSRHSHVWLFRMEAKGKWESLLPQATRLEQEHEAKLLDHIERTCRDD